MFLKMRKLREPFGKKTLVQEDDVTERENPGEGATGAEDILVTQITNLEELVSERTRELEETKEELKQLSNITEGSEEDEEKAEELFVQPNKPESELSVQTEKETPGEEKDLSSSLAKSNEEEAEESGEEDEQGNEGESNSFSDIFGQQEEEENPLAGLIGSLPDVTAEELLDDMKEITAIAREWQQN